MAFVFLPLFCYVLSTAFDAELGQNILHQAPAAQGRLEKVQPHEGGEEKEVGADR